MKTKNAFALICDYYAAQDIGNATNWEDDDLYAGFYPIDEAFQRLNLDHKAIDMLDEAWEHSMNTSNFVWFELVAKGAAILR